MRESSCLGQDVEIYNLDQVSIGKRSVIAQQAYICCGSHDFKSEKFELITAPISIGDDVFVGLRALILPGVTIGDKCIIGGGTVLRVSLSANTKASSPDICVN